MARKSFRNAAKATWIIVALSAVSSSQPLSPSVQVYPKAATDSVRFDADDPAIWIHPTDSTKGVIIGTDKDKVHGGLYVWDLHGNEIQYIKLPRPNNVDVRYHFNLGPRTVDIAVVNLRFVKEMKVFEINHQNGTLTDITADEGIKTPELDKPYGLCLYHRPADGAMFVIQSSGDGESANRLHQYRLLPDGTGKVKAVYVRGFGAGSIVDKVEGLVVDDALGYVYASDEEVAIRKYYADPDKGDNDQIVAFGINDGVRSDREGLAIYQCDEKTGYLLISSQKGERVFSHQDRMSVKVSSIKIYRREGDGSDPHKHGLLATIDTVGSVKTDGLEVTHRPALPKFPHGFVVKHDSPGRHFKIYAWEDIAKNFLQVCSDGETETTGEPD
jgi:3-phytase